MVKYKYVASIQESHKMPIYCISFCQAPLFESYFASVGGNRVTVYENKDEGNIDIVQTYVDDDAEESFFACCWTMLPVAGTPLLAIAGSRGIIKLINTGTKGVVATLLGHGNAINDMCFHPLAPSILFTASKDESVRMWNVATGVCVAIFAGDQGHRDEVLSVDVHLTGSAMVSSGMDNTVKIWLLHTERVQDAMTRSHTQPQPSASQTFRTLAIQLPVFNTNKIHTDYIDCVRWVGDLLLSKSTANACSLWRPNPSRKKDAVSVLREYPMADTEIWFLRFSLDSELQLLATGNKNGKVSVWDVDGVGGGTGFTARAVDTLTHKKSNTAVRVTAFSRDGSSLLYCCDDGTIWRYDNVEQSSISA